MTKSRHLKVSAGRRAEMADDDNFVTTSAGRELVLLEVDYSAQSTQSFLLNGTVYTLGGVDHTFVREGSADASAAAAIVAGGLQLTHTANGAETAAYIGAAQWQAALGEKRFRSGRWGWWLKLAAGWSIPGTCWVAVDVNGSYPNQYARTWRTRNIDATANDTTGGIGTVSVFDNVQTSRLGGDFDTHDVMGVLMKQRAEASMLSGVYSGGWPSFEACVLQGYAVHAKRAAAHTSHNYKALSTWNLSIRCGGSANTFAPIIERAKLVAYD